MIARRCPCLAGFERGSHGPRSLSNLPQESGSVRKGAGTLCTRRLEQTCPTQEGFCIWEFQARANVCDEDRLTQGPSNALNITFSNKSCIPRASPPCHSIMVAPRTGHYIGGTTGILETLDTWSSYGPEKPAKDPGSWALVSLLPVGEVQDRAGKASYCERWGNLWSRAGLKNSIKGQAITSSALWATQSLSQTLNSAL